MEIKIVALNGIDFAISYDLAAFKSGLKDAETVLNDEEDVKHELYSVKHESTHEELVSDIEQIKQFITDIETGHFDFEAAINEVRKKKNGKLWARSKQDILLLAYFSDYFTDFTNAWSTLGFRLVVTGETAATLELGRRTYTN